MAYLGEMIIKNVKYLKKGPRETKWTSLNGKHN